jgi:hypothetical protein
VKANLIFFAMPLIIKFLFFLSGPPYFATAFVPTEGAMKIAHHMRLFSCAPGSAIDFN